MSDTAFSFEERAARRKRSGFRIRRPRSPNDVIFGFAARLAIGLLSVLLPVVPLSLWGWADGWEITTPLLAFYAAGIVLMVLVGEHFRSRIFERVLRIPARQSHIDIDRNFLTTAIYTDERNGRVDPRIARLRRAARRLSDVVIASSALVILWPLLATAACFLLLEGSTRIFRVRKRYDIIGREVRSLRFNVDDEDATKVGRFLRPTGLEGLPMLFGVLTGSLALVGPRAVFRDQADTLSEIPELRFLGNLKPGIFDPYLAKNFDGKLDIQGYISEFSKYDASWNPLFDVRAMWWSASRKRRFFGGI